jgi:ribosomal protein S18 acetylase RimI-like enzyme
LQVIGSNEAAISLYRRAGFSKTGEVEDMFRIDGQCFSYISMTLRLP